MSVGGLTIHCVRIGDDRVVVAAGELDISTADALRGAMRPGVTNGRVILDLGAVRFIDASGLRALAQPPRPAAGHLVMVNLTPAVRSMLVLSGLMKALPYGAVPAHRLYQDRNVAYVRRLWRAFEQAGVDAIAELVPDSVVWRPLAARGTEIVGSQALREWWRAYPDVGALELASVTPLGDAVLTGARTVSDARVWSLYEFAGDRLTCATSFAEELATVLR